MIFTKTFLPIFYLEDPDEEILNQLSKLENSIVVKTKTGVYVLPEADSNVWEWEMDIREILKQKTW